MEDNHVEEDAAAWGDADCIGAPPSRAGGPEGGRGRTRSSGSTSQNGQQEQRPGDAVQVNRLEALLEDAKRELENEKERSKALLERMEKDWAEKEKQLKLQHRQQLLAEQKRWEEDNEEELAKKLRACAEEEREKASKTLADEMKRAGEERAMEREKRKSSIQEMELRVHRLAKENEDWRKSEEAWIYAINEWNDRGDESHLRQIMRRLRIRENSTPGGGFWNQRKTILEQGEEILSLRHEVSKARNKRDEWKGRAHQLQDRVVVLGAEYQKKEAELSRFLSSLEAKNSELKAMVEERDYQVSCLRADMESIERDLEKARNVEKRASTERDVAVEERARLFRMLQSATVKRTGPPQGRDGFPNGDQIKRFALKVQPEDFLHGLRDTMEEDSTFCLPSDKLESYHFVLDNVIVPCWVVAMKMVQKHEERKLGELSAFIESSLEMDEMRERVHAENTLLQLFWAFAMQEGTKGLPQHREQLLKRPRTTAAVPPAASANPPTEAALPPKPRAFRNDDAPDDEEINGVCQADEDRKPPAEAGEEREATVGGETTETTAGTAGVAAGLEDDVDAIPSSEYISWARGSGIVQSLDELDSPTWDSFTEDLILLSLFCKFSDPACYLWPPIGEEVVFSTDLFKFEPVAGSRPRPGEPVRVLFPGLYFVNPSLDPTMEPMCKAVVIASNGRGGNSRKVASARTAEDKGDEKKSLFGFSFGSQKKLY